MSDEDLNPEANESHRVATSDDIEVSTYLEIAKEISGEQPVATEEISPGAERESIIIIDFGSQYSMLIARRIRECNVYCEIVPHDSSWENIIPLNPKGFILSGGPASVYDSDAPRAPAYIYESHLPVLGICYGMQLITKQLGGQVAAGNKNEYGHAVLHVSDMESPLFADFPESTSVWMSHGDRVEIMPPDFRSLAYTENSPIAVIGNGENIYGLQFHPEVVHTPEGKTILENFVYKICGCQGNWTIGNFIEESIANIRQQVGYGRVVNALSGGVDSSVVASLIHRAIGSQLTCIFVNHGLMRREEVERVFNVFRLNLGMNIIYVDASERFLKRLEGIIDPEMKRKIIGEEFIHVFEEEANKIEQVDFLAQGTLYPDVIESASSGSKASAKIKSHHNVGGLPAKMTLKLLEHIQLCCYKNS